MDTPAEQIIMNSCQYTPVYFIENPGVTQTRYIVTQNNQTTEKPVSENLKRFYENSGNLETNLNVAESSSKPKVVKKTEVNAIGNNLKLASFLLPKSENKIESCKQVITPVNNVVLKPVYIANNLTPTSTPKLDVNSKIVKLKDLPNVIRAQNGKILPKIKPKENTSNNKSKHTSVQLLKLGETYHSLNQLSDDQMKIVNHALKIFNNPQNTPPEPTYDPVTNTKFIYKVVSPRDLAVVGKNKINKQRKIEIKKEIKPVEPEDEDEEQLEDQKIQLETKMTRSGRIVKLPRSMLPEESPNKPKRRNGQVMSCLQCTSKFSSPHRLHRHYEHHPSHLPSKLHSDLFQCLLAIVRTSSLDGTSFIQHLELFIRKLKSCIPCLLNDDKNGQPSIINDDVGRLLGINPGKYNLNMDAFNCEKDKNGYCCHNPSPVTEKKEIHMPTLNNVQIIDPVHIQKSNITNCSTSNRVINIGTLKNAQILESLHIDQSKVGNKANNVAIKIGTINNGQILEPIHIQKPNIICPKSNILRINNAQIKEPNVQFEKPNILSTPISNTSVNIGTISNIQILEPSCIGKSNINNASNITLSNSISKMAVNSTISNSANNMEQNNITNNVTSRTTCNIPVSIGAIPVSQENLPMFLTKIENKKHTSEWPVETNDGKKIKLSPEHERDSFVIDDIVALLNDSNKTENSVNIETKIDDVLNNDNVEDKEDMPKPKSKPAHIQFRSAHFDIRSSPIKSSSTVFRKFQINPEKMAKYEVEIIKPIQLNKLEEIEKCAEKSENKQKIVDNNVPPSTEQIDFNLPKIWNQEQAESFKCNNLITNQSEDFLKSNALIEPALLHVKDNTTNVVSDNNEINSNEISASQGQSIISFLESLGNELSYSDTGNRNNSMDFQLDLFSFNNC